MDGADLDGDDVEIPREDVSRTLVAALEAESTYGATFELAAGDEPIEEALDWADALTRSGVGVDPPNHDWTVIKFGPRTR